MFAQNAVKKVTSDLVKSLKNGEIVIYPAESVYGIGCSIKSYANIKKLFKFKQREEGQGFIILTDNILSIAHLVSKEHKIHDLEEKWPSNTTFVFKAQETAPMELCDTRFNKTIAIRITKNDFLRNLCSEVGPVISTSANKKGKSAPRKFCEIEDSVKIIAHTYIINDDFFSEKPSTIIDFGSGKVIR